MYHLQVLVKFLFLGSKFLVEEVSIPKYHFRQFISLTVATRFLSDATNEFIKEDLRLFESIFKRKKTQSSGFNRTNGKVYVYHPGMHTQISSVIPTELKMWGIVFKEMKCQEISICTTHTYHDFIMPFLHNNQTLMLKYNEIHGGSNVERKEANKGRFDQLRSIKEENKSHTHTPFHCTGFAFRTGSYTETEWSIRFFHSIKDHMRPDFKIHLTHDAGLNFVTFQEQYSKCEDVGCYLFHGAPEMVVIQQDAMGGGSSVMVNEVDVIEVKKNDLRYTRTSTIPAEAGQVVASLHFFVLPKFYAKSWQAHHCQHQSKQRECCCHGTMK